MRNVRGDKGLIPSQYAELANDVVADDRILLSDGLLELQVISCEGTEVKCRVIHGGRLGNHKGINLPGIEVSAPSMTEKDYVDARFALDLGVDFIALSFVRSAEDLKPLRQLVEKHENDVQIISKIEKPEALVNAEEIFDATDAIMVARGDLGVELRPEEVPAAQSGLIELARKRGKPVIVATQMLESMIEHSRPTRAEVTDVTHAVDSGADAIMLSGETAVGAFPVKTVQTMDRIARQAEAHLWQRGKYGYTETTTALPLPVRNVIANATSQMSRELVVPAVIVISRSGVSAATVSTARPAAPIIGITDDPNIYRRMVLLWGVVPILDENVGRTNPNQLVRAVAEDLGLSNEEGYVLLVRGFHKQAELNSPSITVITL
jgi:pyruvate kinase